MVSEYEAHELSCAIGREVDPSAARRCTWRHDAPLTDSAPRPPAVRRFWRAELLLDLIFRKRHEPAH